jgi:hypothetical protein
MVAASAAAQRPAISQLSPAGHAGIAHIAPPQLNPCGLRPAPAPYDQQYNRLNSSGLLDVKMVHDAVVVGMRDLQSIMDDLQARTEQVRCGQENSEALLNVLGASAPECPLPPSTPYEDEHPLLVSDGRADVTAVIATATSYRKNANFVLGDMRARVERLACEEGQLVKLTVRVVAERAPRGRIPPLAPQPCGRAAASPSYLRHHIHMNASGIMDYLMAINVMGKSQEAAELWLDDVQSRIEQVSCEQSRVRGQVNSLVRTETARREGMNELPTDRPAAVNLGPPEVSPAQRFGRPERWPNTGQVSNRGAPGGRMSERPEAGSQTTGRFVGPKVPAAVLGVRRPAPGPGPTPRQPIDKDCFNFEPAPSFVQEIRRWGCSSAESCGVYDEAAMKLVGEIRHDTESDGDDLQVRLRRLNCQEQNIDAQLLYVFSLQG